MARFYLATLLPFPLLLAASFWGGWFAVAALTYMTGLTFMLDTLVKSASVEDADAEFPAGDTLLTIIASLHFPLLAILVWKFSTGDLATWEIICTFLAAGMFFGQVGNSTAHELIHRQSRLLHRLGMWMYISLLFGHHTSAHVLVHHRYVATDEDPSSAKLGQSYYHFVVQAWVGSFRAGLRAETERLRRIGRSQLQNPYWVYGLGSVLIIALAFQIGGAKGAAIYIALALYATAQLLLSDYVQHYGLRRSTSADGKPVPVNATHSWNSPHWFSSGLMLNAPRHSDHHAHPTREFTALRLPEDGPMLPRSLPTMATLALFPSLWRRVMDHRALKWQVR